MSELAELPDGWAWTTLRECSSSPEKVDPKSLEREDFVYVDISSVDADSASVTSPHRISTSAAPSRARQQLRSGDTLFSTVRPNLRRIAFIGDKLDGEIGSTGFIVLRPTEALIPRFVFHFVQTANFIDVVCAKARGVSYPAIRPSDILDQRIPLPPLAEQHRTVEALEEHLSRLDAADEMLSTAAKRLEIWAARSAVQAFQSEPVLEQSTIGQECGVQVGSTPSRSDPSLWTGDLPWVSSGEVAFNRIKQTKETINRLHLRSPETRILPAGTVMLAMIGEGKTRGQAAILDIEAAHNQNCASIRTDASRLTPEYLYEFLRGRYAVTRSSGSGGVQPALNKSKVQAIEIPVVSKESQDLIVEEIASIESTRVRLRMTVVTSRKRSSRLRADLLRQAFAGTLVDQDPGDEPASVLLERIAAERANAKPAVRRRASIKAKV